MKVKKGNLIRILSDKTKRVYVVTAIDKVTKKVWYFDEYNRGSNHAQFDEIEVVDEPSGNNPIDTNSVNSDSVCPVNQGNANVKRRKPRND